MKKNWSLKMSLFLSCCKIGKMNVYSFFSRWNHFEVLIATFDCNINIASLHWAVWSSIYVPLFEACWSAAIGAF